jgi:hypothetical protein
MIPNTFQQQSTAQNTAQDPNYAMFNQQAMNQPNPMMAYTTASLAPQLMQQGVGSMSPSQITNGMAGSQPQPQQQSALANVAAQQAMQSSGANGAIQGLGAQLGSLCCWILVYGNGGYLPWFVKPLRDIAYYKEPLVAKGYKWMANWLVPLMMLCEPVEKLVKCLMIQPLTEHCAYIMSVKGCKARTMYQVFWFKAWKFCGKHLTK